MFPFRLLIVLVMFNICYGSGYFEIQMMTIRNTRGEVSNGSCCDGERNAESACTEECDTFFRVCLKEYQARVTTEGPCTFGNISSVILGGNSFTFPSEDTRNRLKLPFDFAWTVSIVKLYLGFKYFICVCTVLHL
jgi:jagged-like protein